MNMWPPQMRVTVASVAKQPKGGQVWFEFPDAWDQEGLVINDESIPYWAAQIGRDVVLSPGRLVPDADYLRASLVDPEGREVQVTSVVSDESHIPPDAADDPVAGAVAEPTGHGSPSEETPAEAAADMLGTLYINLHKEPREHTRQVVGDLILEVIDVLTEWAPVPPPPHVPEHLRWAKP